jgi:hypothetical protein
VNSSPLAAPRPNPVIDFIGLVVVSSQLSVVSGQWSVVSCFALIGNHELCSYTVTTSKCAINN